MSETVDGNRVLELPFETQAISGDDGSSLQVTDASLVRVRADGEQRSYPWDEVAGWTLKGTAIDIDFQDSSSLHFTAKEEQIDGLREQLQWRALRAQVLALGEEERSKLQLESCSACYSAFLIKQSQAAVKQCPHCFSLVDAEGQSLSQSDGYTYSFCDNGEFALVNKADTMRQYTSLPLPPEGFVARAQPLLDRVISYALWTVVALIGIGLCWLPIQMEWSDATSLNIAIYFLMAFSCFSVLMVGYYWSGLMLAGSGKPLFFPPPWEKLNRYLRLGYLDSAQDLTEQLGLAEHPGFLANWALAYRRNGDQERAQQSLNRAMQLCPDCPSLIHLAWYFAPENEKEHWANLLKLKD